MKMNTHHQVVEEQVISGQLENDNSSEVITSVDPDTFKRNYQVDQLYTVAPVSQYQIVPTTSVRNDNVYQGHINLSSYNGPAYLLTTAADGTQQLQPLHEHSLGIETPQIHIEDVQQVEEVHETPVESILPTDIPVPVSISKANFASVSRKNRPYKCDQCTASYLDAAELEEHKAKHTDDGPFTCVDCHFTFMFKSHYRSHRTRCEKKRADTPVKPCIVEYHTCKEHKFPKNQIKKLPIASQQEMVYLNMDSLFATNRKANAHPAKQTSSTRFNPKNPSFKRTKRAGRLDRPFECDECDATFKIESDLKAHRMKHTGEGPFKCEECEFVFLFRKLYESHQRRCTKKRVPGSAGKKSPSSESNGEQPSTSVQEQNQEPTQQLETANMAGTSSSYVPVPSSAPVYNQPTIIEMRSAQPSEVMHMPHSVFDQNVATTSANQNRQDVKYELVPAVEIDGMSMNQIVNLIKVKAPTQ